jgi:hypothetical protein
MKSYLKYGVIFSAIFAFLFVVGLEITLAQETLTYQGSVAGITIGAASKGIITVKGNKGDVMKFAVGWRTAYIPERVPSIGERVKITYSPQEGENVAYQVEILAKPATPPQKSK